MIVDVIGNYADLKKSGSLYKACCPIHGEKTPSLTIWPDTESFYCFGCGNGGDAIDFVMAHDELDFKSALKKVCEITGKDEEKLMTEKKEEQDKKEKQKKKVTPLDKEIVKELIETTGYKANGYRGIRDEVNKFFGHLTKLDDKGKVVARYYPETVDDKLTGYKCRNHPKDFSFGKIGETGNQSQLSGQVKFKSGGKYVLIVGGEEDKAAAYQMLLDYAGDGYTGIPVVSPTSGENSAAKQCKAQYDWLDSYDNILIGLDNDAAGNKAALEVAEVLPKEKVKFVKWSGKDPNEMLLNGQQKQFLRDFYNAKEMVGSGIKSSTDLITEVKDELRKPVISLPPYLSKLSAMTKRNGIIQGYIVNIIGDTSVGKTSHINTIVYHWLFNAPERVGIVSLENTAAQYTMDLLSLHLETNLYWMGDGEEIIEYLDRPEVQELYSDLLTTDQGQPRFHIIDERDGDIKKLEKSIERMIKQYDCKIIVIDVLTDILRSLGNDAQEEHMNWQKRIKKSGITICNVLHTRKPQSNQDGSIKKVTEYDALGSSTFVQSADINIVINRDKMTNDNIERNRTYWDIPKLRRGMTGHMGSTYYDPATRKMYDFDDWMALKAQVTQEQPPVPDEVPFSELDEGGVFENIPDYYDQEIPMEESSG